MRAILKSLLLLTIFPLAVFAPTLMGPFIFFDDTVHIGSNPWLISGEVINFWLSPFFGLYIPVVYSLWSGIYAVTQEPWVFHAFNIFLHCINTVLVWLFVRRWVGPGFAATLGALFFALHGLQVEPVAWISAGRDLIAGFFTLSALLIVLSDKRLSARAIWIGSIFYALALLSKPSVAPLPVVVFGFTWLRAGFKDRRRFALIAFWLVFSGLAIGQTLGIQAEFNSYRLLPSSIFERALVALDSLGFYITKIFWPWPMVPDYGRTPLYVITRESWLWTGVTVLIALTGAVICRRRIGAVALMGLASAVVWLSPVLGIFPFSAQIFTTVSDRYMYLPLFGVALAVSVVAAKSRFLFYVFTGLICIHAVFSFQQATLWQSNQKLFSYTLNVHPNSYVGLNALALSKLGEGDLSSAERLFNAAWVLQPRLAVAPANLAAIWWATDRGSEILRRLVPYISDLDNVRFNRHETKALSVLYLHLGRAEWKVKNWDKAQLYFCNYRILESTNPASISEVEQFLRMMSQETANAATCGG